LDKALEAADWFVCIYTGELNAYYGYEFGFFTAAERNEDNRRVVCLYNGQDYPRVFRPHQARYVGIPPATFDETSFYRESSLAKFFEEFCRYDDLYVTRDNAEAQRQSHVISRKAKRIRQTFRTAHGKAILAEIRTQPSLEIEVAGKLGESFVAIPLDAQAKGTFQAFALMGLMLPVRHGDQLPSTSWGQVKSAFQSPYSANMSWVERVERDMLNVANGRALSELEAKFHRGGKTYRAILTRVILDWNGTRRFRILFVETEPRRFAGGQNSSLILAGLVLASRFRFSYLEHPDRIAAQFADNVTDAEFQGHYLQFLNDLERIRHEQLELDLLDQEAFINSFGPSRRDIIESFLTAWMEAWNNLPPVETANNAANRREIKEAIQHKFAWRGTCPAFLLSLPKLIASLDGATRPKALVP
jgi:hypothetical protein